MVRVHRISGKERGLMVIGTASELRSIGTGLLAGLDGKPEKSSSAFPEMVFACLAVEEKDQGLTFNLETEAGDQPKKVFGDTELGKSVFFVFAVIGLLASVRWVLSHAL
jgi:hypothetical protein